MQKTTFKPMKFPLLLAFLLLCFSLRAQTYLKPSNGYGTDFNRVYVEPTGTLRIPYGPSPLLNDYLTTQPGAIYLNTSDTSLYGYMGTTYVKLKGGSGSGGTTIVSAGLMVDSLYAWFQGGGHSGGGGLGNLDTTFTLATQFWVNNNLQGYLGTVTAGSYSNPTVNVNQWGVITSILSGPSTVYVGIKSVNIDGSNNVSLVNDTTGVSSATNLVYGWHNGREGFYAQGTGGGTYTNGWGLLLSSSTFTVDTSVVASRFWTMLQFDSVMNLSLALSYPLYSTNDTTVQIYQAGLHQNGYTDSVTYANNLFAYNAVTAIGANSLVGNPTGSTGNAVDIPIGYGLTFSSGILSSSITNNSQLANGAGYLTKTYLPNGEIGAGVQGDTLHYDPNLRWLHNDTLMIGTTSSAGRNSNQTILNINLGGQYSNVSDTNMKIVVWDNGSGNKFGLGASTGEFFFGAGSSGDITFYTNNKHERFRLTQSGFIRAVSMMSTGTAPATTGPLKMMVTDSLGDESFLPIPSGGGSSVTSITLNTPAVTYSSPVTFTNSSGAWSGTLSLITQSANVVFAGPSSGSAATPTWRALVAADIPSLDASKITTGNIVAARIATGTPTTGYVPIYQSDGSVAWGAQTGGTGGGLPDPGGNGLVIRTAPGVTANRSIVGTTGNIVITNADGTAGNPTINTGSNVPLLNAVNTFTAQNIFSTQQTATTNTTYGLLGVDTLTAHANNDSLGVLYLHAFFKPGAYTNLSTYALKVGGAGIMPDQSGTLPLGSTTRQWSNVVSQKFTTISTMTLTTNTASTGINFQVNGTNEMEMLGDGSIQIQNGGTFGIIASSIFTVSSTSRGSIPYPVMSNSQMNAISSPVEGLTVYDNTNHQIDYYNGTAWTVLSSGGGSAPALAQNYIGVGNSSGLLSGASTFTWNGTQMQIGTNTASSTATPLNINLGGTYSSSAGANPKLLLYYDGQLGNTYGMGVAGLQFFFNAPATATYDFYNNTTKTFSLLPSGNIVMGSSDSAATRAYARSITTTLTGDVTGSGSLAIAAVIASGAVTYSKMQNETSQTLLGRYAGTNGSPQEITIGAGLTLNSSTGVLSSNNTATTNYGTYTPSAVTTVNNSSITFGTARWYQVGSMVTVSGKVTMAATTSGTQMTIIMTLPSAVSGTTFTDNTQADGVINNGDNTDGGVIVSSTASGSNAQIVITPFTTSSHDYRYSFTYQLL